MPRGIPNQAKNTPVSMTPEISTASMHVGQAPDALMEDRGEVIVPVDKPLEKKQADALAFAEEEITIYIQPGAEENAPLVVDCWVNGKGAEVFTNGRWHEFNCIPVGVEVTTKRKYVEVLARSKTDKVQTQRINDNPGEHEDGYSLRRSTASRAVFSVLNDKNPKGREWLTRLMAER